MTTMDTKDFDSNDFMACEDEDKGPASLPTTLPAPPRMPNFVPHSVSVSITAPRRILALVASNPTPNPMQTRATVPALRVLRGRPSGPPPSIPPTGSTPIRRAA
ncbi:MAG: hypothetical protein U0270_29490 [Labilithrix sp.]